MAAPRPCNPHVAAPLRPMQRIPRGKFEDGFRNVLQIIRERWRAFDQARESGAAREIRTPDPLITNEVLYQLSYCGV